MAERTLLVTGASGHSGSAYWNFYWKPKRERLSRPPVHRKNSPLLLRGVIVREADFDDPASLAKAFAGVHRLLLISTDAIGLARPAAPQRGQSGQ